LSIELSFYYNIKRELCKIGFGTLIGTYAGRWRLLQSNVPKSKNSCRYDNVLLSSLTWWGLGDGRWSCDCVIEGLGSLVEGGGGPPLCVERWLVVGASYNRSNRECFGLEVIMGMCEMTGCFAPGSEEARVLGCRCSVVYALRKFGLEDSSEWTVMMVEDCPVHVQGSSVERGVGPRDEGIAKSRWGGSCCCYL